MHALYLHGFASSPRSTKAAFFESKLAARGVSLVTPDFNEPSFETLTVSRMLGQVSRAVAAAPAGDLLLVGSSLGAFVAVLAAAAERRVTHLVLLAPALDFSPEGLARVGDRSVDEWRRTGRIHVFHYGFGRMMPLGYGIYTDVAAMNAMDADVRVPTLVFQGRRDTIVDPATVERWAAARPDLVRLTLLDDDHQLAGSLDTIWQGVERLLWGAGLGGPDAR
jgi:pimeloyl-ACP methyl ester carboxylesterase